jgi:membrane-associated phospholipid phosphatase
MSKRPAKPDPEALGRKVDEAAIAPHRTRHYRAAVFQAYVLVATVGFVALAVAAHFVPYFAIDLTITRAVQSNHGPALDALMRGLSWMGWNPQASLLVAMILSILLFVGLRWETVAAAFAAFGTVVGSLVKMLVYRPRPTADLVHVFSSLSTYSFPSGHVLLAMCFYGFIAFLMYALLNQAWYRVLGLTLMALIVLLMGPSRIYLGQHWFSDVMGAYVLGSLWLALSIRFYRWGKRRFFLDQPAAAEAGLDSRR